MDSQQPNRITITERTLAMPHVEGDELINEPEALAFWEDIRVNNPGLYDHLSSQIAKLDHSLASEIGDTIQPHIRRGIIARVAIASAAQIVSDTGQSIIDIRTISALFDNSDTLES